MLSVGLLNIILQHVILQRVILQRVILHSVALLSNVLISVGLLSVILHSVVHVCVIMLNVILHSVVHLCVILLSVILLNVVAPLELIFDAFKGNTKWSPMRARNARLINQGIPKREVSLYCWPPVWLVWNQLYDYWQFLFFIFKTDQSKPAKQEVNGTTILPHLVFPE
jgi:hypothetical protein